MVTDEKAGFTHNEGDIDVNPNAFKLNLAKI